MSGLAFAFREDDKETEKKDIQTLRFPLYLRVKSNLGAREMEREKVLCRQALCVPPANVPVFFFRLVRERTYRTAMGRRIVTHGMKAGQVVQEVLWRPQRGATARGLGHQLR